MSLYIHELDNVTSINLEIRLVLHSIDSHDTNCTILRIPFRSRVMPNATRTRHTLRNSTPTIPSSPRNPILARKEDGGPIRAASGADGRNRKTDGRGKDSPGNTRRLSVNRVAAEFDSKRYSD